MITVVLRDCYLNAADRRKSADTPVWRDNLHALVVESIWVAEKHRRKGVCKRFLDALATTSGYDLVVVEAVGNPTLADALRRWGWECDPGVMDFFRKPGGAL